VNKDEYKAVHALTHVSLVWMNAATAQLTRVVTRDSWPASQVHQSVVSCERIACRQISLSQCGVSVHSRGPEGLLDKLELYSLPAKARSQVSLSTKCILFVRMLSMCIISRFEQELAHAHYAQWFIARLKPSDLHWSWKTRERDRQTVTVISDQRSSRFIFIWVGTADVERVARD